MTRRSEETSVFELEPGDYRVVREPLDDFDRFCVWVCTPKGDRVRIPVREGPQDTRPLDGGGSWGFEEHEDGSVTLTPSIDVHGEDAWHGYLIKGTVA